jgi:SAM-dependent methyltransferase
LSRRVVGWQAPTVVDRLFADAELAELYDTCCPTGERGDFGFHLRRVMPARAVLDVGCGTGELLRLAREAGHTGRLCGLDPAAAMLAQAKRKRRDVEWVLGDLGTAGFDAEFDLVVMTGHVFQVFTEDDELRRTLAAVRSALADGGRFSFETRNPKAREWERWTPAGAVEFADPHGGVLRWWADVEAVEGDLVRFTNNYAGPRWERPQVSRSTLRFLDVDALTAFLSDAGMTVEELYGDWDGSPPGDTSPEIIVVATRD